MMNEDERIDAGLAALFAASEAAPGEAPDEAFVARVERVVHADRKLASARAAAWRRFRGEVAASLAIVTTFALLWRLAPAAESFEPTAAGPAAAAALLLLFLWFAVELRPAATGR